MFADSYLKKCKTLMMEPLVQDDLVELCKNLPKYKKKSYLQLLSNCRVRIGQEYCSSYLEHQTLNDIWLLFYIYEKDGRLWDEGACKFR